MCYRCRYFYIKRLKKKMMWSYLKGGTSHHFVLINNKYSYNNIWLSPLCTSTSQQRGKYLNYLQTEKLKSSSFYGTRRALFRHLQREYSLYFGFWFRTVCFHMAWTLLTGNMDCIKQQTAFFSFFLFGIRSKGNQQIYKTQLTQFCDYQNEIFCQAILT